jgi:hypothetical protein
MVLFDSGAGAAWRVSIPWWLLGLVYRIVCHAAIALELTSAVYSHTVCLPVCPHQRLPADLWRPDDLIGRISLPLSSLDLTPGAVNDLWLPVPRNGKRTYDRKGGSGSGSIGELPTRVHALRVEDSDTEVVVAQREDTAADLTTSGPSRQQQQQQQQSPSPSAGAPASTQPQAAALGAQRSPAHGSPGLQHLSPGATAMQQLRQLAANPLDALRAKPCLLHITATYLPLTEQEIAEVAKAAGRQQQGGGGAVRRGTSSAALGSGRLDDLLHRCSAAGSAAEGCVCTGMWGLGCGGPGAASKHRAVGAVQRSAV